jgi:hypothetical protein
LNEAKLHEDRPEELGILRGSNGAPALYFSPPANAMHPKEKSECIKELKKELKTIIDSGTTLNNKEKTKSHDIVVSPTEANKIKLDQDGNVDKLKV